jgi:hypothetical protein
MTKSSITAIERSTLEAAAIRNDFTVFPVRSAPNLNAGAVAGLMKRLIAKGFAEERIATGKTPVWRTGDDGQRFAVVASRAGLEAVGMLPSGKAGRRSRTAGKKGADAANKSIVAGVSLDEPRTPRTGSKLAVLIGLLERKEGATIGQLSEAVGWKAHSVRGVLSGTLTKRFGVEIVSERGEGLRVYRLVRKNGSLGR